MRARGWLLVIAAIVGLAIACRGQAAAPGGPRAPEPVAREVPVEIAWPDAAP